MCGEPLGGAAAATAASAAAAAGAAVVAQNSHTNVRPSAIEPHSQFDSFAWRLVCPYKTGFTTVFPL